MPDVPARGTYVQAPVEVLSEEADEFRTSLDWNRYDYSDGPHHQYRPLFISPRATSVTIVSDTTLA